MCNRYFGCLLLVWFPAVLHAQSETQSCSAPELLGGVFAPRQKIYSSGTQLTYICNEGLKPAVKGWWATITCENGKWSHEAQCIDVKACIPPSVPNGHYTENSNGWYEEGYTMRTVCNQGYEHRNRLAETRCVTGEWTSLPVCENTHCSVDTTEYPDLVADGVKHIRNGGEMELRCVKRHWYWMTDHYSLAQCFRGKIIISECRGYAGRTVETFLDDVEVLSD